MGCTLLNKRILQRQHHTLEEKSNMFKSFITILLLALGITACSQPVRVTTLPTQEIQFAQPMASPTATALFPTIGSAATTTPTIMTPIGEALCAAPVPRVQIGDKVLVTVENWDRLKLRSKPEVAADNVVMDLDQYSQLKVLDGPICAYSAETGYSYYFWQVVVIPSGEKGWVAEGDYTHYFFEKY